MTRPTEYTVNLGDEVSLDESDPLIIFKSAEIVSVSCEVLFSCLLILLDSEQENTQNTHLHSSILAYSQRCTTHAVSSGLLMVCIPH